MGLDWTFLAAPVAPRVHLWPGTATALVDAAPAEGPRMLRWLRGSRMRTRQGLMDEWAAAAQFPPYFGATWDALRDGLADLPEGGTFLILEADQLLREAPAGDLATLVAVLSDVAGDLAPQPFHVVLQVEPAHKAALLAALQAAKAPVRML